MIARLGLDGVQRGHEDVYWFGLNVPMSSGKLLMLLALGSVVGGYKRSRERRAPKSLWVEVERVVVEL
jgi:hypothetical protein